MSMIGKSLVHYEITAEIGKGGMGEVYQAKDPKLERDVTIMVLPEEFAQDADRLAYFRAYDTNVAPGVADRLVVVPQISGGTATQAYSQRRNRRAAIDDQAVKQTVNSKANY